VVVCLFALAGAWLILILIRGEFQSMMVESSTLDLSVSGFTVSLFICFALFTGFVSGFFPALYFSKLNPIEAIKSKFRNGLWGGLRVRKTLTIFQFALSFCFIFSLVVFGRQYHEILNFDFGFQKDNVVILDLQNVKPELVNDELSKLSDVQSFSFSSGSPATGVSSVWIKNVKQDSISASQLFIDQHFFDTYNLELINGTNFTNGVSDKNKIIVNEQFLTKYKLTQTEAFLNPFNIDGESFYIIGIVKDFYFMPPPYPVSGFVFRNNVNQFTQANILVSDKASAVSLFANLENVWKKLNPDNRFSATFLNEDLNDRFLSYRYLLKMAGALGLLAITISVLGLLGMVIYTTQNRIKEISIRKVVGASVYSITILLSKEYVKLLSIAILFGIPMSYLMYEGIFTNIPDYQADLRITDFLFGSLALLILGILTITSQTYKAALLNPAETLKNE
jgi:ABC-type antimicrobial peptide transport system permease subunit